ncbi:hypothetical protein, partial [Streptomyces sp. Agncl-13]|uniref:hypothetical protein n=1 Tax=Streptomyces sp. Agncl-13 TaxID=3400628 RepID=UPI003A84D761
ATLEHVLTDEAFAHMAKLSERFAAGVQQAIDAPARVPPGSDEGETVICLKCADDRAVATCGR